MFNVKCKHVRSCPVYRLDSATCNKTGGEYYDDSVAGCYVKMEGKSGG
jgi:hypothetical protein